MFSEIQRSELLAIIHHCFRRGKSLELAVRFDKEMRGGSITEETMFRGWMSTCGCVQPQNGADGEQEADVVEKNKFARYLAVAEADKDAGELVLRDDVEDDAFDLPFLPTEAALWNGTVIPCPEVLAFSPVTAIPKLTVRFLSFQDYLIRCYRLYWLETTCFIQSHIHKALASLTMYFDGTHLASEQEMNSDDAVRKEIDLLHSGQWLVDQRLGHGGTTSRPVCYLGRLVDRRRQYPRGSLSRREWMLKLARRFQEGRGSKWSIEDVIGYETHSPWALPIKRVTLLRVEEPRPGEIHPAQVTARVPLYPRRVTSKGVDGTSNHGKGDSVQQFPYANEWQTLRPGDVVYLLCIDPSRGVTEDAPGRVPRKQEAWDEVVRRCYGKGDRLSQQEGFQYSHEKDHAQLVGYVMESFMRGIWCRCSERSDRSARGRCEWGDYWSATGGSQRDGC